MTYCEDKVKKMTDLFLKQRKINNFVTDL